MALEVGEGLDACEDLVGVVVCEGALCPPPAGLLGLFDAPSSGWLWLCCTESCPSDRRLSYSSEPGLLSSSRFLVWKNLDSVGHCHIVYTAQTECEDETVLRRASSGHVLMSRRVEGLLRVV